jgi:hypothetical protein
MDLSEYGEKRIVNETIIQKRLIDLQNVNYSLNLVAESILEDEV